MRWPLAGRTLRARSGLNVSALSSQQTGRQRVSPRRRTSPLTMHCSCRRVSVAAQRHTCAQQTGRDGVRAWLTTIRRRRAFEGSRTKQSLLPCPPASCRHPTCLELLVAKCTLLGRAGEVLERLFGVNLLAQPPVLSLEPCARCRPASAGLRSDSASPSRLQQLCRVHPARLVDSAKPRRPMPSAALPPPLRPLVHPSCHCLAAAAAVEAAESAAARTAARAERNRPRAHRLPPTRPRRARAEPTDHAEPAQPPGQRASADASSAFEVP